MDQKDLINNTIPHVPVEGSRWGDAEFYGNWLSAALSLFVDHKRSLYRFQPTVRFAFAASSAAQQKNGFINSAGAESPSHSARGQFETLRVLPATQIRKELKMPLPTKEEKELVRRN